MTKAAAKPKEEVEETTEIVELSENLINKAYKTAKFDDVTKFITDQVDPARVYDMTNKKDMADCRSNAHNVARSKSLVEKAGEALIKAEKAKVKKTVDSFMASKKLVVADLAALQATIRTPLTQWEDVRSNIDTFIGEIEEISACFGLSSVQISTKLTALDDYDAMANDIVEDKLNEFLTATTSARETLVGQLDTARIREKNLLEVQELKDENAKLKASHGSQATNTTQEPARGGCFGIGSQGSSHDNAVEPTLNHKRDVNNKIVKDLVAFIGIGTDSAKKIVIAAAKGNIGHLKIEY